MDDINAPGTDQEGTQDAELSVALLYLFHPLLREHTRYAYRQLPPREEMKVGRVAAIYDRGQLLSHLARFISVRGHDLGRFEKGCYIILPADFPSECDVHVTDQGVHAVAKVGEEYRTFIARPAATTEAAWENYELQRGWTQEYPNDIGRVFTPPRLTRQNSKEDVETEALISAYAAAEARPGVTEIPRREIAPCLRPLDHRGFSSEPIPERVFTPPRALAVYRHPPAEDDPHHLDASLTFAVRLCAERRAYVAIFLPEGAEGQIPALLERARALDPRVHADDAQKVFDGKPHTDIGYMTEENAASCASGHDNITLVTRAGRDALLAGGRPDLDLLFSAVVAAPGSFADETEARDLLTRHFNGAHLALIWTDVPPPAHLPATDCHPAGTIVTYDAQHLAGTSDAVERALAHPWVAARVGRIAAALSPDGRNRELVSENLLDFARAAARSAARIPLDRRPLLNHRDVAALFGDEARDAWPHEKGEGLVYGNYAREGEFHVSFPDLWRERWGLLHLSSFLVTLARVHPGELPAGEGLEDGPWLDLAEQVLLPDGGKHSVFFDEHTLGAICEACRIWNDKCVRFLGPEEGLRFDICRPCHEAGKLPADHRPETNCRRCRDLAAAPTE